MLYRWGENGRYVPAGGLVLLCYAVLSNDQSGVSQGPPGNDLYGANNRPEDGSSYSMAFSLLVPSPLHSSIYQLPHREIEGRPLFVVRAARETVVVVVVDVAGGPGKTVDEDVCWGMAVIERACGGNVSRTKHAGDFPRPDAIALAHVEPMLPYCQSVLVTLGGRYESSGDVALGNAFVEDINEIWDDAGIVGDVCSNDGLHGIGNVVLAPPESADVVIPRRSGEVESNVVSDTFD